MLPQWMTTGSTPIKGVKRTNAVVVRGQGQGMGVLRRDSYTIEKGTTCLWEIQAYSPTL